MTATSQANGGHSNGMRRERKLGIRHCCGRHWPGLWLSLFVSSRRNLAIQSITVPSTRI